MSAFSFRGTCHASCQPLSQASTVSEWLAMARLGEIARRS
jgi:hypothetical protein